MAYVESHQGLGRHPKTKRAARLLGVSIPTIMGHLSLLWHWALDYAQDGDVTAFEPADLAEAAMWEGDPDLLVSALVNCRIAAGMHGFLEQTPDGRLLLHDWWLFGGKLIVKRKAHAEQMAAARATSVPAAPHKKEDTSAPREAHVGGTRPSRATPEKKREEKTRGEQTAPKGAGQAQAPAPPARVETTLAVQKANVILHLRCDEIQRTAINDAVPDSPDGIALWEKCLTNWRLRYPNNRGLQGPLDWFAAGGPPPSRGQQLAQAAAPPKPRPMPENGVAFGPEGLQPAPRDWRESRGGAPSRIADLMPKPGAVA